MAANNILARLAVQITADNAKFGAALNQSRKDLAGFGSSLNSIKNLLAGFGLGFGIIELTRGIKNVIGIMAGFESSMSEVKAITGATGREFEALTKDALRLGASTKFTAKEVSQLQVAYGRLGFTTKEILNATEATLNLAAATGEDLAKAADVAGSTVRGFGLNAKETERVVDVMASSFNKTALGLENFTESMKYVAPIANAANVSVEETTALLGVLADSGIRGSQAGTSLRKIFGDLTKDGRPLQERLAELSAKGITLADSYDEVGRTAQTALLVLSKNTDKTNQLTEAFRNASGEAAQMARIMQDNLTGDVTKLTSAFEGLILKVTESRPFREFTQQLTAFVSFLATGGPDVDEAFKRLIHPLQNFQEIVKQTGSTNEEFKQFLKGPIDELKKLRQEAGRPFDLKIVEELANKYNLSSRAAFLLRESIKEVNAELSFQERAIKVFNEFAKKNGYTDLKKAADDYIDSLNKLIVGETNAQQKIKQSEIDAPGFMTKINDQLIAKSEETISGYLRIIDIIKDYKSSLGELRIENELTSDSQVEGVKRLKKEISEATGLLNIAKGFNKVREDAKKANEEIGKFIDSIARIDSTTGAVISPALNDLKLPEKLPMPESMKQFLNNVKTFGQELKTELINISGFVADGISGIAEAVGTGFATNDFSDFGKTLIDAVASFAQQLGKLMIAIGLGEIALKGAPGPAKIAAGFLLVAAGAAVKSVLSRQKSFPNAGTGGGRGGSRVGDSGPLGGGGLEIKVGGEFKIKGNDLVYIFNRTEQLNSRTGG